MKKLMMMVAGASALALTASAGTQNWFNANIGSYQADTAFELAQTGGSWTNDANSKASVTTAGQLDVDTALGEELAFTATNPKDLANGTDSVTITSQIKFNAFASVPAVPADAKAALIVVGDAVGGYNYYGLGSDGNGDPAFVMLEGTPDVETFVSVEIVIVKGDGVNSITYKATDATLGTTSVRATDNTISVAGYSGTGSVQSLSAVEEPAAPPTYTFTLAAVTGIDSFVVSNADNTAEIAYDNGYTVEQGATVNIYAIPAAGKFVSPASVQKTIGADGAIDLTSELTVQDGKVKIGSTFYLTLKDAATAAQNGDIIYTIGDITYNEAVYFTGSGTITLSNDYNIVWNAASGAYQINVDGPTLVLKGSGTISQPISDQSNSTFLIGNTSAGNVTMESGTVDTYGGNGIKLVNGTFTMNGGTLYGRGTRAIKADGADNNTSANIVINGGTVTTTDAATKYALFADSYAGENPLACTITVNGGSIDGKIGTSGNNSTIVIPGTSDAKFKQDQSAFCELGYYTGAETIDEATWYVAKACTQVAAPTAVQNLFYDGTEKTGVAAATGYTVADGAKTAAGNYIATATLEVGYVWTDGGEPATLSKGAKEINWSIAAALVTPEIVFDPADAIVEYSADPATAFPTVTIAGDYVKDTDYTVGEWSGSITEPAAGTTNEYTVTVTMQGNYAGSNTATFKVFKAGAAPAADWPDDPSTVEGQKAGDLYENIPTALANVDAGALATWAKAKGVAFSAQGTIKENAFLLDCANTDEAIASEQANFKASISIVEGVVTVTPANNSPYKNGKIVLQGRVSLTEGEWAAYDSATHKFARALLVPATVAAE